MSYDVKASSSNGADLSNDEDIAFDAAYLLGQPAWKAKPTFAIVSTQDRMINPDLERSMYQRAKAHVTEIKASHAVLLSQPRAVAHVIEEAARHAD